MENRREMMKKAHEMTRAARETWPGIDYRATLAAALRELWAETQTETARNLGIIRLTIAAILQHAEDVTAARTPAPAAAADPEAARRAQEARQAAEEAAQEDAARQQAAQQQPQTLEEFFAAPGELQLDMIRRMATRCPDRAMNRTRAAVDEDGSRIYNEDGEQMRAFVSSTWAAWMTPRKRGGLGLVPFAEAVEEVTAEAWMILQRINPDPAAQEAAAGITWGAKKPLKVEDGEPLGITLAHAADLACKRLDRQHRDKPTRAKADPASLDDPDFNLAAHLPSPEPAALNRESIRTAARSESDLAILDLAAQGYNRVEIGRALGITRQAVEKHLKKMQTRLQDAKTEQAANDLDAAVMAAAGVRRPSRKTWTPDNAGSGSSTGSSAVAAALYSAAAAAQEDPEDAARRRADIAALAAANAAALAETARRAQESAESADEKEEARAACAALADDARRAACAAVIMSEAVQDAYITDAARRACAAAARASNSARLANAAARLAALDNALSQ